MSELRIVVLGAGGFIGSHLVPGLLERFDCHVDAIDLDLSKLGPTGERVRRKVGRVEDPRLLDAFVDRADVVLSLTALCNPSQYSTQPLEVIHESFTHLLPLVERCAERRVRLIHFSTAEVYGMHATDERGLPAREMREDASCQVLGPLREQRWTYACAKQLLERVIWAHGDQDDMPFVIVRPFNTIGPRMDYLPGVDGQGIPRVLACFMNALLRGQPLPLVNGGAQRRAFMDVSDMVEAVCRIVARPAQTRGQVFNLGNPDNDVSIAELAARLAEEYGALVPQAALPKFASISAEEFYGPGYADTLERIPDISKARELLDWLPRRSLAEMLPGIVRDYVERYGHRVRAELEPESTRIGELEPESSRIASGA